MLEDVDDRGVILAVYRGWLVPSDPAHRLPDWHPGRLTGLWRALFDGQPKLQAAVVEHLEETTSSFNRRIKGWLEHGSVQRSDMEDLLQQVDPAAGGARKSERTKPRAWLEETRQAWAAEMNLAFDRAGVADRVTSESHAAQLAPAREAGDAAETERLLLNPPSEHIGPAAKHSWEDRSLRAPALKPDRYAAYEEASASAREVRSAHAPDVAEAAEARSMVETLDAEIAALEAEQRRADAAVRQRQEANARREAEPRRVEAKRDEERKARRTALVGVPGGVELFLANLADLDPKWNVDGNDATAGGNIDAALDAAASDETRLVRLRAVLSDDAADARFRQQLGRGDARFGTADLDDAVATAEALRRRVSRVRELFAAPGGDAALVAALDRRSPSWSRTGTPTDIERALDVAERRLDRRQAATWEHRVVLDAEHEFPNVPAAAWRRTGERFNDFTETGRPAKRLTQTLSDRARAVGIPVQTDHRFRSKSITDSGRNRTLIPAETDQRFRSKPITVGRR